MTVDLYDFQQQAIEVWRPVVGYEGHYEVSNCGRVKSCGRKLAKPNRWGTITVYWWTERLLALTIDRGKYAYGRLQVKLSIDGAARTRLVHQLVAEAFIGPRPEGMEVAHNDGNPANNRVDNLRYATPASNSADQDRHGTRRRGEQAPNTKLTLGQVRQIRGLRGKQTVQSVANKFGISIAQTSRIQRGLRWGHAA